MLDSYSRLLQAEVFGPIIKTSKVFLSQLCISFVLQIGMFLWKNYVELSIISIKVKANTMFPDDFSHG